MQNQTELQKQNQMLNKVPEVTFYFWIIKVLCTTVGETASDFLNVNLNFGLIATSIVMGFLLVIALLFQFRVKKYIPSVYWINVVLISVFGTLVTDNLTDNLKVPLEYSTILFSIILALTFIFWYAKEKTLAIHSIFTRQREMFYWLTILFTFALGTATGDLMAESLGLGYFQTGEIVLAVIAIFAIAWRLGLNSILAFWMIYIMTRPLGASLGDYLSQSPKYGGLGLGATITSGIFLAAILMTVILLSVTKKDLIKKEAVVREESEFKQHGVIVQVAIVVGLIVLVSGAGYYWRHNALQIETQNTFVQSGANGISSNKIAVTLSPLGDLSNFQTITQDTLNLVNSGDLSGAKARVNDLEYEWDNSQARLKPMNTTKWTVVDSAIDKVLRELRAVNQNAVGCKYALEALLKALK